MIPSSGATLIQLVVDNARGELLPGGYAEVTIPWPTATAAPRFRRAA